VDDLSCKIFGDDPVPFNSRPVNGIGIAVPLEKKIGFDLASLQSEIQNNLDYFKQDKNERKKV
jgi:hypothetical protein